MTYTLNKKYYPLICCAVFAFSTVISVLVSKLIITGKSYAPYSQAQPDNGILSFLSDYVDLSKSSVLQILAVYLAGFSLLASAVGLVVLCYRGIAFGYTVSMISVGDILIGSPSETKIAWSAIEATSVVSLLYLISTILIGAMCYLSVHRFQSYICFDKVHSKGNIKYSSFFLILSGAVFTIEFFRQIVL